MVVQGFYAILPADSCTYHPCDRDRIPHVVNLPAFIQQALSSDGEKVAVIRTGNQNILIYEIETNALLQTIPHAPFVGSKIIWSMNTNYLAVIGEETKNEPYEHQRFVWSLKNQELIAQENFESPSNNCSAIAFHPSSNYLATGYIDGRITLESLKSKKIICSDFIHTSQVESIVFTGDGKRMISGGEDRTVSMINLEELEQL